MGEGVKNLTMLGILICLAIIAFKVPEPHHVPSIDFPGFPASIDTNGETVVQLSENIIAIVDLSVYSGGRGNITVLEFNSEEKSFELLGNFNYINESLR